MNAVNAGQGELEILVNDGNVPCTVQSTGNRRFHATFTPKVAVPHEVEVRFNGQEVAGMFSVLIRCPLYNTVLCAIFLLRF